TDTWDTVASLPLAVRNSAAVLGPDGKIYVMGGISGTGTVAAVQTYDVSADTWVSDTELPAAVSNATAVVDALGRIEGIGGLAAAPTAGAPATVSQRLNQPDQAPAIPPPPVTTALVGQPYGYQVVAAGNPQPTFTLVTAPAGMTIDHYSGLITWLPVLGQAGDQSMTVRASKFAGQAHQSLTLHTLLETVPPSVPTRLPATTLSTHSVRLF